MMPRTAVRLPENKVVTGLYRVTVLYRSRRLQTINQSNISMNIFTAPYNYTNRLASGGRCYSSLVLLSCPCGPSFCEYILQIDQNVSMVASPAFAAT